MYKCVFFVTGCLIWSAEEGRQWLWKSAFVSKLFEQKYLYFFYLSRPSLFLSLISCKLFFLLFMLYVQLSHGSFELCTTEHYQLFISMHNSQYIPALHWGGLTISPSLFPKALSKISFSVSFTYSFFCPFLQILANSLAFHPLSGSVFLSVLTWITLFNLSHPSILLLFSFPYVSCLILKSAFCFYCHSTHQAFFLSLATQIISALPLPKIPTVGQCRGNIRVRESVRFFYRSFGWFCGWFNCCRTAVVCQRSFTPLTITSHQAHGRTVCSVPKLSYQVT